LPLRVPTLLAVLSLAGCARFGFDARPSPVADAGARPDDAVTRGDGRHGTAGDARPTVNADGATRPTRLRFAMIVQGQVASFLELLDLDLDAPAATSVSKAGGALRLDAISGNMARSLTVWGDTLLVGSGAASAERVGLDPLRSLGPVTFDSSSTPVLEDRVDNLHGLCTVAGRVIGGEFGHWQAGNAVGAFVEAGASTFRFAIPLYRTTTAEGGSLSECAGTATDLYLADYGASADTTGTVVQLSGSDWNFVAAHRFDPTAFQGAATTPIYSIVLHTNGSLYLFPQRRYGSQLRTLVRCPAADISAANCVALGLLPPDAGGGGDVPDGLQGAAQIPGRDDMLFSTNRQLYRYNLLRCKHAHAPSRQSCARVRMGLRRRAGPRPGLQRGW
jgi:hypothetical protein